MCVHLSHVLPAGTLLFIILLFYSFISLLYSPILVAPSHSRYTLLIPPLLCIPQHRQNASTHQRHEPLERSRDPTRQSIKHQRLLTQPSPSQQ